MKKPFALLWILIGGILVFSWVYLPTISRYRDLKLQHDELDEQLEKLTREVQETREERDLLKNDVEYLEKVIRGELGLVKPGEIVYKFVKDTAAPLSETQERETSKTDAPVSDPQIAPAPVGETFTAKPVADAKSKLAVVTAVKPKTALTAKAKTLPPPGKAPAYPRRETR